MSKISFEDIGSLLVTFHADTGVQEGQVVKVSKNGTVAPCQNGDLFCGLAATCKNGLSGVQVQGFAQVPVTLPVGLGQVCLVADGQGGVRAAGEGDTGSVTALVVDVDTVGKTAVVCL